MGKVEIPWPWRNDDYEAAMGQAMNRAGEEGMAQVAFGDLFLEDIREYRVIRNQRRVYGLPPDSERSLIQIRPSLRSAIGQTLWPMQGRREAPPLHRLVIRRLDYPKNQPARNVARTTPHSDAPSYQSMQSRLASLEHWHRRRPRA